MWMRKKYEATKGQYISNHILWLNVQTRVFLPDIGDALFVDAAQQDYRLMSESPALDVGGSQTDLIQVDLRNLLRDPQPDAGALEFFAQP